MKKLLFASLLAVVLSIVPLTLATANGDIVWETEEGYGINSEAHIEGVYAGWTGTVPLIIINGKDKARTFLVTVEKPTNLVSGFEALPEECFSWIVVSNNLVTVSAGETIQVPVTITIPANITYVNKRQQTAIEVKEVDQGFVQIAVQCKWFIISVTSIKSLIIIVAAVIGGGCGVYLLMRRRQKRVPK
jgi:hypothetical protein